MSINDLKMFENFSFTQMLKNVPNTYVNFYNYMFNDDIINNVVWNRHIINFIILLFTVINLILIAIKNKLSKKKIVIIAVCILILKSLKAEIKVNYIFYFTAL